MRVAASLCFVWMLGVVGPCEAIDNPDAPDFVAEFNARAKKYDDDIRSKATATETCARRTPTTSGFWRRS